MSVLCEAISVIVRRDVLDSSYPSRVRGYRVHCPNRTWCADAHLTRVGFMHPDDARAWIDRLGSVAGLAALDDHGRFRDLAVVDQLDGLSLPCDWIETEVSDDDVRYAWLTGTEPGRLEVPDGWKASPMAKYDVDRQGRLRARTSDDEPPVGEQILGRPPIG